LAGHDGDDVDLGHIDADLAPELLMALGQVEFQAQADVWWFERVSGGVKVTAIWAARLPNCNRTRVCS